MSTYYSAMLGATRPDGLTNVLIGFGTDPAANDTLGNRRSERPAAFGGRGILFHGAASLPVAMALAHAVAHLYGFVACHYAKIGR